MVEFTRRELRALLWEADAVLQRAADARELIDAPRGDAASGQREIDALPNAWGRIRQYLFAAAVLSALRGHARRAAPGPLRRLTADDGTARARVAARDLQVRLHDRSFRALDREVRGYLETARRAASTCPGQRTGTSWWGRVPFPRASVPRRGRRTSASIRP